MPPVFFGPTFACTRAGVGVDGTTDQRSKQDASLYDPRVRVTRCPRCLAEDITAALTGGIPRNLVNPAVLTRQEVVA